MEAVRAEYKADPGYYTTGAYMAGLVLEAALTAVNGRVEDKAAFMKALRAVRLADSPIGPLRLDEHGNPVLTVYIRKVEKKDGELQNTVIQTYPAVSQFWKYNPEEYLKQPAYTRDYPPCKHCQ